MLRPQLKIGAVAAGAFAALSALYSPAVNAVIIADASIDGGAFQTIGTAANDVGTLSALIPSVTGSISATAVIEGAYPTLQLSSTTAGALDSLVLRLTMTDIDTPDEVERLLTGYSDTVPIGAASIEVESFIDPNNQAFGTTIPVADGGPLTGPITTSILTQLDDPVSPLYSLTLVNRLTDISRSANFTSTVEVVPEPGSLGLLGTGLVLAGLMLERRRRKRRA